MATVDRRVGSDGGRWAEGVGVGQTFMYGVAAAASGRTGEGRRRTGGQAGSQAGWRVAGQAGQAGQARPGRLSRARPDRTRGPGRADETRRDETREQDERAESRERFASSSTARPRAQAQDGRPWRGVAAGGRPGRLGREAPAGCQSRRRTGPADRRCGWRVGVPCLYLGGRSPSGELLQQRATRRRYVPGRSGLSSSTSHAAV